MGYKNVSYMLIGGIKKTEIFRMLVEKISYNIINKKNKQGKDIMDVTGPRVLQKILGEIYTDIQFNDGKFGGKIKRKFQNREYTFFYTCVNTNTKSSFYSILQRKNKMLPYYKYDSI